MRLRLWIGPLPLAAVSFFLLLCLACEKEEEEVLEPTASRADSVLVTADKDTILTAGRDSALWSVQLYKNRAPFTTPSAVVLFTDLGYFKSNGAKVQRASFATDGAGRASVYFYGGNAPGFATTLAWGEGFGIDTTRTVLVYGAANTLRMQFRDFAGMTWKETDTLISGSLRGRADSNQVRVTVLDPHAAPVPGMRVDLAVLRNGAKALRSICGYFKGTVKPDSIATSTVYTDANGEAFETYYTDDSPNSGTIDVQIAARVDSALFGRATIMKYLLLRAP